MPPYEEGPLVVLCVVGASVDSALFCGSVAAGKNLSVAFHFNMNQGLKDN